MRIGHGYDVHRFESGDHVFLGGVKIPFTKGLLAHSDGDVLLHAICDALLGAAGLGDIGRLFPDTESNYKGVSSRVLLKEVGALLEKKGFRVVNIDATVLAEAPRVTPYADQMCGNIASDLNIVSTAVNVKGTTTEKMGFLGRGDGIASEAVCLLESNGDQ
ncbi:MAG: 2-C-methyl-D-erythritol 2,4-cyclodiphosphate synthase [Gammaproteobacteria bacterium]|jgi:2-C-methyl-D-erythritol 2,4-cyclodiphosphate synthase|tara:strand:- start:477 stop:959 length:483 start_codon:yes stop_codon:yes gene_type:complete